MINGIRIVKQIKKFETVAKRSKRELLPWFVFKISSCFSIEIRLRKGF